MAIRVQLGSILHCTTSYGQDIISERRTWSQCRHTATALGDRAVEGKVSPPYPGTEDSGTFKRRPLSLNAQHLNTANTSVCTLTRVPLGRRRASHSLFTSLRHTLRREYVQKPQNPIPMSQPRHAEGNVEMPTLLLQLSSHQAQALTHPLSRHPTDSKLP